MPKITSNTIAIYSGFLVLLVLLNINSFAQDKSISKPKEFSISVEKVGSTVLKFKCPSKCAWLEFSFNTKYEPAQLVDEFGMTSIQRSGRMKDSRLADFLFSVDLKGNEVTLKGLHGTNWKELSFILPDDGAREFTESGL